jgi:hypothetical protein
LGWRGTRPNPAPADAGDYGSYGSGFA